MRLKTKEAGTYFCPPGNQGPLQSHSQPLWISTPARDLWDWEEVLLLDPELEKPILFLHPGGPGP